MTRSNVADALVIPDSLLAKEATEILRKHSTDLLFNHSVRVYLFAAAQAARGNCASTQNSFTWPPHFTTSAWSRSSRVKQNASRSMAQMPPDSSSTHTTLPKIR